MRQYRQLTEDDRIEIYAMKQAGNSQAHLAQYVGVHPRTLSRELARNTGRRGYRPKQAHRFATERGQGRQDDRPNHSLHRSPNPSGTRS